MSRQLYRELYPRVYPHGFTTAPLAPCTWRNESIDGGIQFLLTVEHSTGVAKLSTSLLGGFIWGRRRHRQLRHRGRGLLSPCASRHYCFNITLIQLYIESEHGG
jgi:hypothetical protein